MMKFKGTFNYMGTSYTLYTTALDRSRAFINFLHQTAKKAGYSYHYVSRYFMGGKDNYLIEEIKEDEHGTGRKRKDRKFTSSNTESRKITS